MRNTLSSVLLAGLLFLLSAASAEKWDQFPSFGEYFPSPGIRFPGRNLEKIFRPAEGKANFTLFHGLAQVAVKDGLLEFSIEKKSAVLGWGNALGRQPLQEVADLWEEQNNVILRVRQTAGKSTWRLKYWADGKALGNRPAPATLRADGWQELSFPKAGLTLPTPDGIELAIEAPAGARFQIQWIKFIQPRYEGYARKEFELPRGKVWKAVADIGSANDRVWFMRNRILSRFYLNGQLVQHRIPKGLYATVPVDITQYLQPGRNCSAFYGYRIGYTPFLFFRATIIMESGKVYRVQTDRTWKYSPDSVRGWNSAGFDDGSWSFLNGGQSLYESHQLMPPAYAGRLDLRNPYKKDLFFASTRPVLMKVLVPRGLANLSPRVQYRISRAKPDGTLETLTENAVSFFEEQSPSLLFRLDLGHFQPGTYAIGLRLLADDGSILEERSPEPFVVLRKKPLKTVQGNNYLEGLDLELEDTIDFANPEDPHPWVEGKAGLGPMKAVTRPRIVRKNGLVYREVTGDKRSSWFSYRFQFKRPGDFYLLELEYPDDADRILEVSISTKKEKVWTNSQAGVGAETGGKFFKTGKMQKLRWIHVADSGVHSIDILNVRNGWNAAAKVFRIYHVRGDLPSVSIGHERFYGIHSERCYPTSGIGMNFGVDMPRPRPKPGQKPLPKMQRLIKDLVWMARTSERYVQYLNFSGQNFHLMGCIQYNEYNTPFIPADRTPSPRITRCLRTVLANVFEMNGIDFLAGMEFSNSSDVRTFANDAQVARGADSLWMINPKGAQFYGITATTVVPNWQHPGFVERYQSALSDIVNTFGGLKHFRGVSNFIGPTQRTNYYLPAYGKMTQWDNPLATSFDDITFRNFQKETGIEIPIDRSDPRRFEKRAALMTNRELRQQFLDWRCRKLRDFFRDTVALMRGRRSDLQFFHILGVEDQSCFRHLLESGRTFSDLMKDFAIDLKLLGNIPNSTVVRWTTSWRQSSPLPSQDPYAWVPRERQCVLSAFKSLPRQAVLCRTSWDENVQVTPGHSFVRGKYGKLVPDSDWILDAMRIRALPQPGGPNAREALIQAIITSDPQLLLTGFTDLNINVGHEQALREVMCVFTHLPPVRATVELRTGLESNLAIRTLRRKNDSFLYVANPGYWKIRGTVVLESSAPVLELLSGKEAAGPEQPELKVDLPPFGLSAWRSRSPGLRVKSFRTGSIAPAELSHMTRILGRIEALLGDREVRLVLSPADRSFMRQNLNDARSSLEERRYARAWSLVKKPRFWSYWKDFLEKAARAMARLPGHLQPPPIPPGPPQVVRNVVAARAEAGLVIDGKLSEPAWEKAPLSGQFLSKDGKPAMNQTAVRILFDRENIYFGFLCADRDPGGLKADARAEKDIFAARDDVLDLFIQPDEFVPLYYQLAFNAAGTQFDQKVRGGERDYSFHPHWKSAVATDKTYWSAEVKLPFKALGLDSPGVTHWRINFFRLTRNHLLSPAEWSYTANRWHTPRKFGRLIFRNK